MTVSLNDETRKQLMSSICRFFSEELEEDIGDLKAMLVLDFCLREIAPSVYNQAIADAQTFLQSSVEDLAGVKYEPEFDYWSKR